MTGSQKYTVVLANLMGKSGKLNGESVERIELALALEEVRQARKIILCGWAYRPDSELPIAEALKTYVAQKRPNLLPKIICQSMSRDTVGDAFFTRILMGSDCCNRRVDIDIVTSGYHVARAAEVFRFIFPGTVSINVESSSARSSTSESNTGEARSLKAFHKTFEGVEPGDLYAIHSRLASSHPFYNGDVYPKIDNLETILRSLSCEL
jgi:uncharacterized SAM-binding protein YcdF (DUF218 family)